MGKNDKNIRKLFATILFFSCIVRGGYLAAIGRVWFGVLRVKLAATHEIIRAFALTAIVLKRASEKQVFTRAGKCSRQGASRFCLIGP